MKKEFRKISLMVVASLMAISILQCVWVWRLYRGAVADFVQRVEYAAYKSMYQAFFYGEVPGLRPVTRINIDLDAFSLYFEPTLLEYNVLQPYAVEVVRGGDNPRVMMGRGEVAQLERHIVLTLPVADSEYSLRVFVEAPYRIFLGRVWWLLFSSFAIVLLLALVLAYLVRTMFRVRELDEMRRDFTHNITHELKTPISVALTAADAMRNFSADADVERRSRYLEIVETQLERLSAMVERILKVSVHGSDDTLAPVTVALSPLIAEVVHEVSIATPGDFSLTVDCPEDLCVKVDAFHFKNIIATLLDNAFKYCDKRPVVSVNVQCYATFVAVSVADNGCGIAREHCKHIFEKFYRVPTGDVQAVRGYGLGLYYVKQAVLRHGGSIDVSSRIGEGTKFTVKLPYDG
ncbi:MAG: HAMP domain-containing histidine kinase [Bacteroidaceae bacterium]|nr:HAMP domain-containing histidine kinase [Bacteroidaceae bacterium]